MSEIQIDGITAQNAYSPTSESEARTVVLDAIHVQEHLLPIGGGTSIATGNTLRAPAFSWISSEKLNSIHDYSPDDMVVTVGAGVTLQSLQETLVAHGQFVPINTPHPEKATLGGIVATNAQGHYRSSYGTPRDRLLGLRAIIGNGDAIKAGGKVVKNVAGYDLCKLFAGSWGTLGFITEVTFKTNPIPPVIAALNFECASASLAAEAALLVHTRQLDPVCLSILGRPGKAFLHVRCAGSEKMVNWQVETITDLITELGCKRSDSGPSVLESDNWSEPIADTARAVIRVKPTECTALFDGLQEMESTINCILPAGRFEIVIPGTVAACQKLETLVYQAVGPDTRVMWLDAPETWKSDRDVWGGTHGDFKVMQGLKAALDPHSLFSPGRFSGRL